jgi:hypothetical protein
MKNKPKTTSISKIVLEKDKLKQVSLSKKPKNRGPKNLN